MGKMTLFRRWAATLATAGLLASGCGGGSGDSSVVTIGVLSAALADTAEASTYRVSQYSAQTVRFPALDYKAETEFDDQPPAIVGTVSRDRQHFAVDIGGLLGPLVGGAPDIGFGIWVDSDRVVVDSRDFQQLKDLDPEAQFGPFEPGVSFVDLNTIKTESPDLLAAIVGSPVPDLSEMALSLPAALKTIKQTGTDPQTFVGTATFADLVEAQGVDLAIHARSTAAGVGLNSPVSVDALTDLYIEFFRGLQADVFIELDERGLLRVFEVGTDLSGIYDAVFEDDSLFPGMTEQERSEAAAGFKGAELILKTRSVYEADIDLDVPQAPEVTEDRTEVWREFLVDAGFRG